MKGRFMSTLRERRRSDRERQTRWRQSQRNQGKKQISSMISLKAQIMLNREKKRTGESNSEIIERAILNLLEKRPDEKE
jgi:hypothetical protein